MKKMIYAVLSIVFAASCSNENFAPAENGLVASQYFLDACLKGDFKKAQFYMVSDSVSLQQLASLKKEYYQYNSEQRQAYRTANIVILKDSIANDSTEYIKYQNSFDKENKEIKAVKITNSWKVEVN